MKIKNCGCKGRYSVNEDVIWELNEEKYNSHNNIKKGEEFEIMNFLPLKISTKHYFHDDLGTRRLISS